MPDEIRVSELETIGVRGQDVLTPPPLPTPPYELALQDNTPEVAPTLDSGPTAQPVQSIVREQRRAPLPTERVVTKSSRTREDAFVTNDGYAVAKTVSTAASIHNVEVVLQRHRDEVSKNTTANISVREAFRTRGDEAKKVIVSELK